MLAASDDLITLYLAALATPGVGGSKLKDLVTAFGGIEAVTVGASAEPRAPTGAPGGEDSPPSEVLLRLRRDVRQNLSGAVPRARRELAEARRRGLQVLCWEDGGYPPALREDGSGCAPVLFVAGRLPPQVMEGPEALMSCAIVGTRRASAGALSFTKDLARAVAREQVTVVSGLALGVDSAAHEGALEAEAATCPTIAVLGGGHDRLHPAANRSLAERILRRGGAVISEWPPSTNPQPFHFLRRNRVIAGLSRVVAITEAGKPSGALNTAGHAADLGRQVVAAPSRPREERNRGALELLRDGAAPLIDESDVLHHFGIEARAGATATDAGGRAALLGVAPVGTDGRALGAALQSGEEVSLDRLSALTGAPATELLPLLGMWELEGKVERTVGGRYRRRA